jgi:hypothetical protein
MNTQKIYRLKGIYYRLRLGTDKLEVKSGHSNVWMLDDYYKTIDKLLAAGATEVIPEVPR